jgi:hypothetical protein
MHDNGGHIISRTHNQNLKWMHVNIAHNQNSKWIHDIEGTKDLVEDYVQQARA